MHWDTIPDVPHTVQDIHVNFTVSPDKADQIADALKAAAARARAFDHDQERNRGR